MGKMYITVEDIVMVNVSEERTYVIKKGTVLEKGNGSETLGANLFKTDTGQNVYLGLDKVREFSNGSIKKL